MPLTQAQILEAVDAFKSVTIAHGHQTKTLDLVLFMLELSPNTDIVNLVGPTGVGKSMLQAKIIETLHRTAHDRMFEDPDFVPIIRTHALASGHRRFNWKTLYRDALFELGDPFAGSRKASKARVAERLFPGELPGAAELRMCLEDGFRRRGTKIWIIDEAQHLVFGGQTGLPGDQFDVLKSIAQAAGVKLLLAGPYQMELGLASSGQLARRSVTIHYPRYAQNDGVQLQTFSSTVMTLFSKMNVAGYPAVVKNIEFFFSGCAGCVGMLKDWLARGYGLALRDVERATDTSITLDHLREARISIAAMQAIMDDIRSEEENLANPGGDEDYVKAVTGLSPLPKPPKILSVHPTPRGRPKAPKPGTRSLGPRDKVGLGDEGAR